MWIICVGPIHLPEPLKVKNFLQLETRDTAKEQVKAI